MNQFSQSSIVLHFIYTLYLRDSSLQKVYSYTFLRYCVYQCAIHIHIFPFNLFQPLGISNSFGIVHLVENLLREAFKNFDFF